MAWPHLRRIQYQTQLELAIAKLTVYLDPVKYWSKTKTTGLTPLQKPASPANSLLNSTFSLDNTFSEVNEEKSVRLINDQNRAMSTTHSLRDSHVSTLNQSTRSPTSPTSPTRPPFRQQREVAEEANAAAEEIRQQREAAEARCVQQRCEAAKARAAEERRVMDHARLAEHGLDDRVATNDTSLDLAFDLIDRDGDGKISRNEWLALHRKSSSPRLSPREASNSAGTVSLSIYVPAYFLTHRLCSRWVPHTLRSAWIALLAPSSL